MSSNAEHAWTLYIAMISTVDNHGEKTSKHFDKCGSHDDKNTFYVGGIGQFSDVITSFWNTKYKLSK